jgi:hypothetical protein
MGSLLFLKLLGLRPAALMVSLRAFTTTCELRPLHLARDILVRRAQRHKGSLVLASVDFPRSPGSVKASRQVNGARRGASGKGAI